MSIENRIADAELLWKNDHKDGAFLCALVAIAGTARKRYPKDKDNAAFTRFLGDCSNVRLNVEFRGQLQSIEMIFYKFMRCEIVHEGGIPPDIGFGEDLQSGEMTVRAGGAPEYVLEIGTGWFFHLLNTVRQAKENSDLFTLIPSR